VPGGSPAGNGLRFLFRAATVRERTRIECQTASLRARLGFVTRGSHLSDILCFST